MLYCHTFTCADHRCSKQDLPGSVICWKREKKGAKCCDAVSMEKRLQQWLRVEVPQVGRETSGYSSSPWDLGVSFEIYL